MCRRLRLDRYDCLARHKGSRIEAVSEQQQPSSLFPSFAIATVTITKSISQMGRQILGGRVSRYVRKCFRRIVPTLYLYRSALSGRAGLEIGGPSGLFSDEGPLPIYRDVATLDNCLYSATTIWTGTVQGRFEYHPRKRPGNQIICEASDLRPVPDAHYECVLASHCLEHVANPLRALGEWKRVLKDDGVLLLVLPHRDGTFDWRRPRTPLAHMVSDYKRNVGEGDLTHLAEILELHDLSKDKAAGSPEQFRQRCLANLANRAMHHHVFDTRCAIELVDRAAFQVIRVDTFQPYHIIILARRSDKGTDNQRFMGNSAEYRNRSPFPSDRATALGAAC